MFDSDDGKPGGVIRFDWQNKQLVLARLSNMKIGDHVQNLGLRIGTIQIVAFILLALLGVRLYYLQIVQR